MNTKKNNMEKGMNAEQDVSSYLTFKIGNDFFAANVANVVNIQEMTRITEVPKTPDYFMGVINLRGKALPVIDPRKKLNISVFDSAESTCILVMEITGSKEQVQIGMLVDGVDEVIEISRGQVQPPPSLGENLRIAVISGFYKVPNQEKFTIILDVNKLLTSGELDNLRSSTELVSELI